MTFLTFVAVSSDDVAGLAAGEPEPPQSADRGAVLLTGSLFEYPHSLHWDMFKFSAKARRIVYSKVIGCPQAGQMTSFVSAISSLTAHLWTR
jgi:hypothetical protein